MEWKFLLLLVLGPVLLSACNYQYTNITVDSKLVLPNCSSTNAPFYQCASLNNMLDLLLNQTCCSTSNTDVFIRPGNYKLYSYYTLKNLCNIRFIGSANNPATIQCEQNNNISPNFDTGLAFIAVRNLSLEHLTIVGCGMIHVSTSANNTQGNFITFHSALFIQNSTNVLISNVNISDSNGIGLSVYDTNGNVTITNSLFNRNFLKSKSGIKSIEFGDGGGGIYIEFTKCSPGIIGCDSHNNSHNTHSKYLVENCTFESNVAVYSKEDFADDLAIDTFLHLGLGGALSLWFDGEASNNSITIKSCIFESNAAESGGAIAIQSRHNTTYNSIVISNCSFINNTAMTQGGGGISVGYVIYQTGGEALHNTYSISDCSFKQNQALKDMGGGVVMFFSREPSRTQPTNSFEIRNSIFDGNMARCGSAIQANREFYDSIAVGIILTLMINNCTFTSNNLIKSQSNESEYSSIGAVTSTLVNFAFVGRTSFVSNNFTALVMASSTVEFTEHSITVFDSNSGVHGGAIMLIGGAWIKIHPHSNVSFLRNNALISGGAIHVDVGTPFDHLASHVCFIRYYKENVRPRNWLTNFTFQDNKVNNDGNGESLFTSTLNPCHNKEVFEKVIGIDITVTSDSLTVNGTDNATKNRVSTSPRTFEFHSNHSSSIRVAPGKVFDLPLYLVDEIHQNVSSSDMFIANCIGASSPRVLSPYQVTNGPIQIAGKPNDTCLLHLQTNVDYPVATTTLITLLNCPPGLVFDEIAKQCKCLVNSPNENAVISGCQLSSFQAYFYRTYWIGYQTDNALKLLYGSCPFQYCYSENIAQNQLLPQEANKSVLDSFVCGNKRRTGKLCGQCISGYSVAINSPTFECHRCDTHKPAFGTLILLGTYIIPVTILFYIIMAFNIRMTTGPIGAFLFYSQIVSCMYRFTFDYSHRDGMTLEVSNIVMALYSFSNLDFFSYDKFGKYCIFQNAGTVDILAFNLLLSFYPLLLNFIFFVFIEYCSCKNRCFHKLRLSRSITHGLCAFLILCFAKLNVTAFTILKSTDIFHIDGETYKTVVYFQGNIEYFKEWPYILYALGAIVTIITVITIPTLILVLHPIMIKCASYLELGDSKIIAIINKVLFIHKLKPILDSFQGDYKDNMRYFAGLQNFVYRIMFFYIGALPSSVKTQNSTLLMIGFLLCIIILVHMLAMPFKQYKDNAVYSLVYVLMLAIVIVEYYLLFGSQSGEGNIDKLFWLEILMLLLPLICVLTYYSYKLLGVINNCVRVHVRKNTNQDVNNEIELDQHYDLSDFPERLRHSGCYKEDEDAL